MLKGHFGAFRLLVAYINPSNTVHFLISSQLVKNKNTNTITMEAFFTGVQANDVYRFKAKTGTTNLVGVVKKTSSATAVVFFYKGEGGLIHPKDGAATCTVNAA